MSQFAILVAFQRDGRNIATLMKTSCGSRKEEADFTDDDEWCFYGGPKKVLRYSRKAARRKAAEYSHISTYKYTAVVPIDEGEHTYTEAQGQVQVDTPIAIYHNGVDITRFTTERALALLVRTGERNDHWIPESLSW